MKRGLVAILFVALAMPLVACEEDTGETEAVAEGATEQADGEQASDQDEAADDGDDGAEDSDDSDEAAADVEFEYPGMELDLSDSQRAQLAAQGERELCPCDDATVSLHECMQQEERCEEADEAAQTLIGSIQEGSDGEALDALAEQRAQETEVHDFALDNVPHKGNPDADIVIVEFADFSCGQCKRASQVFEQVLAQYEDDIVVYFKHFPLGSPQGQMAAQASLAAHEQGRFWEMHDLIFEVAPQIDRPTVVQFARQLGLNFERFRNDLESDQVTGHIRRDRAEGSAAGVMGTPAVYINGEKFNGMVSEPALSSRIEQLLSDG